MSIDANAVTGDDGALVEIAMDAHVHIHACFGLQEFFDSVARNFARRRKEAYGENTGSKSVICLTESSWDDKFGEIAELADGGQGRERDAMWRFQRTADPACLVAGHPERGEVFVIAGRQVVTAERLEVLGLGTTHRWADGDEATSVIEALAESGSLPVLPWGFGKWMGARRRIVRGLIDRYDARQLCLGDNSGRPRMMPEPPEFRLARHKGYKILPGSDPLPFRSERGRAGAFGFSFRGTLDERHPWPELRRQLLDDTTVLSPYGNLESPFRFARNQVAMQYVSRARRRQ